MMEKKWILPGEIESIMEQRGIKREDLFRLFEEYEHGNADCFSDEEGRKFLIKKQMLTVTYYAEFSVCDNSYIVEDCYCHTVAILSDN